MNFEDKYKKYKQKYLGLKDQLGGHILRPEGSTLIPGKYGKIHIPLILNSPVEIFERKIHVNFHQGMDTFTPYIQSPVGQFELSNTFFSNSPQIYTDIYAQLKLIPHNAWIMCLRYSSHNSPSDCQIGISGSVKVGDNVNGILDMRRSIRREFAEETGLQITNDIVCENTMQHNGITYVVARSDISYVDIVPPVKVVENTPDIRHFKVWCVPYVLDKYFDTFKAHLNSVGNLNVTEANIESLVFIRNDNLRNYVAYSLKI